MRQLILRGVPAVLMQDMWWFDGDGRDERARRDGRSGGGVPRAMLILLVLVGCADFLFMDHAPGLSLAVFALLVAMAVWALLGRRQGLAGPALLLGLSVLPVIEHVQALSVAFLLGGSSVALCWAALGSWQGLGGALRRFVGLIPVLGVWQVGCGLRHMRGQARHGWMVRLWRGWAFPVAGLLIFGALILSANPVLSEAVGRVFRIGIRVERLAFWLGMALLLWPVLAVALDADLLRSRTRTRVPLSWAFGINAQSVANALVTFNLVMLVQTGLDAAYLWAGAALPDGMSYATYAHRGAYPLVLTALLAGAFALAARPYLAERPGLKRLVYLWLAQNVLLVVSSLLRLSHYVEAYGLTYLRVHAVIWMGLVAAGLCLTGWQIFARRSNLWLMTRCAGLGLVALYTCCFVNFAALIAENNLRHFGLRDPYYLCHLGPMAAQPLMASKWELPCNVETPAITNWREWGFRADRVIRSLPQNPEPEVGHENTRGR
ncbi:DUF4173 domain-containing protein [Ruegeria sp. 2012CJ41-6]|uniref:DUF4173 domain-containing protein n=1 Tax=Ruegeria spongiae TaxID=2942209 RepID=A0ABT0Q7D1_9RHOB|nr:DUF4173 domain-containing protein [Ruegeria spongiae]MCL6285788.1 DUF4173 domain-containing protein [Ruegeria spongiae]